MTKKFEQALKNWADKNIEIMSSTKHLVKLSEPKVPIDNNSGEFIWEVKV